MADVITEFTERVNSIITKGSICDKCLDEYQTITFSIAKCGQSDYAIKGCCSNCGWRSLFVSSVVAGPNVSSVPAKTKSKNPKEKVSSNVGKDERAVRCDTSNARSTAGKKRVSAKAKRLPRAPQHCEGWGTSSTHSRSHGSSKLRINMLYEYTYYKYTFI